MSKISIASRNTKTKKKKKQKPKGNFFKTLPHAILFVMILNGLALASFVVPTGSMEDEVMTGDFLFVNRFKYGPTTPQIIPLLNIPLPNYHFPGFWEPESGDVIVFVYPGEYNEIENEDFIYFLKRCIATAGDTLQIINSKIYINGKHQPDPDKVKYITPVPDNRPARFPRNKNWTLDNYGPIVIPKAGDVIELNEDNINHWSMFITREGHKVVYNQLTKDILIDGEKVTSYKVERDYCFGMGDNRHNSDDSRSWGFIPYDNVVGTPMIVYWSWDTGIPFLGSSKDPITGKSEGLNIIKKLKSTNLSRIGTLID